MYSFKSLEKVHSIFFEPLVIGTTFSGSPSILTVFAGLSSLIKSVSKTCCPCMPLPACHPTTCPSCPLVSTLHSPTRSHGLHELSMSTMSSPWTLHLVLYFHGCMQIFVKML